LAAAKETVAMLPARCYTRIVIQQTQRPVARHTAAGFSLLELFLVAVIIFIPFTFSISPRSKSHQDKAPAECRNHRQNICAALRTFPGTITTGSAAIFLQRQRTDHAGPDGLSLAARDRRHFTES
jgi:hypothetical protein